MPPAPFSPRPADEGLDEWELKLIRNVVFDFLSTRQRKLEFEREDLEQECQVHWWQQRSRYVENRGASRATFLRSVVNAKLIDLERRVTAQKRGKGLAARSLEETPSSDDDDGRTLREQFRDDSHSETDTDLRLDIERLRPLLSARQRRLLNELREGRSMSDISRSSGIPRPTLYDELARIQAVFRDAGLEDYLR